MTLLPPNATPLERALETLITSLLDLETPLAALWSPSECPVDLLPYLAWALSVDDWNSDWTDGRKRAVIAAAIEIQRHKGTPWAIKRTLAVLGFGSAQLVEHYGANMFDGSVTYDGSEIFAPEDHWAEYRLVLDQPITIARAEKLRRILETVAPARCHLKALDFTRALNIYDGSIFYDGAFSYGVS